MYQVEVVLERIPEQVVVATLHLQQQFAGILGGDGSLAHAFEQSLLRLTDGVVHRHHIESHACHVLSLKGEFVLQQLFLLLCNDTFLFQRFHLLLHQLFFGYLLVATNNLVGAPANKAIHQSRKQQQIHQPRPP